MHSAIRGLQSVHHTFSVLGGRVAMFFYNVTSRSGKYSFIIGDRIRTLAADEFGENTSTFIVEYRK